MSAKIISGGALMRVERDMWSVSDLVAAKMRTAAAATAMTIKIRRNKTLSFSLRIPDDQI
jgi:hypothetical protein